jgi:hypothetical protein
VELVAEVLRYQAETATTKPDLGPGKELNRGGHYQATLSGREGGDVSPAASQIEADGSRGREGVPRARLRSHRATHQSCTVTSSPLMSMVTPRTRRFIP